MGYEHHGDRLVPCQQRFTHYTRFLIKALGVPVHNTWVLRPAVVEGSREIAPLTGFNALIWMPPAAQRAGDLVLIDSTHFTTLFGGTDSLRNLWRNLATMA